MQGGIWNNPFFIVSILSSLVRNSIWFCDESVALETGIKWRRFGVKVEAFIDFYKIKSLLVF